MAIDTYQISLKAILKRADGKILALNGRIGGAYEGFYDIPGGRIDQSEFATPLAEIIRREVREELGDEIEFSLTDTPIAIGRHQSLEGSRVLYVFFEGAVENADVAMRISKEHVGWAWLDLSSTPLETYFVSGMLEGMKQWYTLRHETPYAFPR
ncbi:NUDIX hydrolase [Patescibacteria group bacterium]|nr:NUDIX hydrolase [Patescibacteria group bacterium]